MLPKLSGVERWNCGCCGVPKWVKMFVGILLLPVCLATAKALWEVVAQTGGGADRVWLPMLAGVACWIVVYLLLPKPMWVYVFGHELTHAVWTWIFGGRVKGFKAGAEGGHVVSTKSNFLIVLAPYFFPFYAVLLVLVFVVLILVGPGIGPTCRGFICSSARPMLFMSRSPGTFCGRARRTSRVKAIFFRRP